MMPALNAEQGVPLRELVRGLIHVPGMFECRVCDVTEDSRAVTERTIFIARRGAKHDATTFASDVARAGACAMIFEGEGWPFVDHDGLLWIPVDNLASVAGAIADRFFESPSRRVPVIAITGTNGKSSVAHYVAVAAAKMSARPTGTIGTLGAGLLPLSTSALLTTPDCVSVHRVLAQIADASARLATIECSSHALDQQRLAAVAIDTAVFTNLSRDHLDYHGDMDSYLRAKLRLVSEFSPRAVVLNADDPVSRRFRAAMPKGAERIEFSLTGSSKAHVCARALSARRHGIELEVRANNEMVQLQSRLLGRPQAENLLASLATLLAAGFPLADAAQALSHVCAVRGRLQTIDIPGAPLVVVDYAHTPAALESVLQTLSGLGTGAVWCVFGAGGDRDRGKRPLMGRAVAKHAQHIIVTDDNPRGENGQQIIDQVVSGVTLRMRSRVVQIRDRGAAIRHAIGSARANDIVLIAGKGHETYQIIGDEVREFDDVSVATKVLKELAP